MLSLARGKQGHVTVPVPFTTKLRPFSPDTMTRGSAAAAKEFLGDSGDVSWGGEDWGLREADCGGKEDGEAQSMGT